VHRHTLHNNTPHIYDTHSTFKHCTATQCTGTHTAQQHASRAWLRHTHSTLALCTTLCKITHCIASHCTAANARAQGKWTDARLLFSIHVMVAHNRVPPPYRCVRYCFFTADCTCEQMSNKVWQGCSVRGSVKGSGSRTFTHFNKP
jgi:hypothetical protein